MMILISCAKTMTMPKYSLPAVQPTSPVFSDQAHLNALEMKRFNTDELQQILHVNPKIAAQNYVHYHNFFNEDSPLAPSLAAYTGIVFKHIAPTDFNASDWDYAQQHLRITSFLYGLLRPLDAIRRYRLEGDVYLPAHNGQNLFDYWRPLLTDLFIKEVCQNGGLLFNLASAEMKNLFDWKRIEKAIRIITPEFYVRKGPTLKTVVIYTKMCRGEMTRFLLKNRIEHAKQLAEFSWEGFHFNTEKSSPERPVFILS